MWCWIVAKTWVNSGIASNMQSMNKEDKFKRNYVMLRRVMESFFIKVRIRKSPQTIWNVHNPQIGATYNEWSFRRKDLMERCFESRDIKFLMLCLGHSFLPLLGPQKASKSWKGWRLSRQWEKSQKKRWCSIIQTLISYMVSSRKKWGRLQNNRNYAKFMLSNLKWMHQSIWSK